MTAPPITRRPHPGAAADDRFSRLKLAELTIALATNSARAWDLRVATSRCVATGGSRPAFVLAG